MLEGDLSELNCCYIIKRTVRTVPERRRGRIIARCGVLYTGAAFPHSISWEPKYHRLVWVPQYQTTARSRSTAGSRTYFKYRYSFCVCERLNKLSYLNRKHFGCYFKPQHRKFSNVLVKLLPDVIFMLYVAMWQIIMDHIRLIVWN